MIANRNFYFYFILHPADMVIGVNLDYDDLFVLDDKTLEI